MLSVRPPSVNISPLLLLDLHWLPVEHRMENKLATVCYSMFTCTAPANLSDLLELYPPPPPPHHALSTPLLTLASSVFRTDIESSKDNMPFLSLVLSSVTISLFLCNMLKVKLCLPSSLLKTHLFSVSYS